MLHHIEINVSNLERSIAFWERLLIELGYVPYQRWESGISWRFEQTYLVFVQTDAPYAASGYHRKQIGLNHLAFSARSQKQVDDLADSFKRQGVPILYPERYPYAGGEGHYALFVEDPDRIKVEIVAPNSDE